MIVKTPFVLMITIMLIGCVVETTTETVSIDELFWSAYRSPEGFDTYLDTQTLDSRTSSCFIQHRDMAFANEEAKLLECSVILEGSPAWNECHDEADAFHNHGVIMNDIANAIEGPGNFDETEAYVYLIIAKSALTDLEWNAFIDSLDQVSPPLFCEYEGEEKWFWE